MSQHQADPAYILKVLKYLCTPGQVVELRSISGDRRGTISGYFNDFSKLAKEAANLSGTVPAVYFTPNPVKPAMLSRAVNRLRERTRDGDTTGDQHIQKRTKFLLDFDSTPEGVSGISSTDTGHETAIAHARQAKGWLEKDLGFPALLLADSANGGHLMGELDLENTPENAELLKKCLEAIALRFEDQEIKVDQKVFNAARVWKLYGTWACKGDETEDRHHRQAKILSAPKKLEVISKEKIVHLASLAPQNPKPEFHKTDFDLDDWMAKSGLDIALSGPWQVSGWKWIPRVCPWNSDHANRSAYIMRLPSGAISAGCHHNGCAGKGWHDLRDIVEPGWQERRSDNSRSQTKSNSNESHREEKTKPSPWEKAKSAPDFCAEEDKEIEGYAKALLYPGTITVIAAPRGIGKTLVLHALAVAIAKGEYFRGEKVNSLRVLLVDRDNPRQVVRQRIRGWGGGVLDANNLKVLTREDAPDLKDKSAWEAFPVGDYDVVLIDSLGSFTEGVTEKEGKETTQMLATLLDFIRKGPAVVALTNCTKDALNTRGRGEWQDRVDIQYEVRDATAFTPSGKKDWWLELPEAGESAWADRAARRKSRIDYRLAFIPSKFRLGAQPEPFCLEVRLPENETWTLTDVTNDLVEAAENTVKEAAAKKAEQEEAAVKALAELVKERHAEKNPILKTEAEIYLNKEMEIPRKRCRELLKAQENILWEFHDVGGKGAGKGLFPRGKDGPAAKTNHEGKTAADHAQSGRQGCDPHKRLENNGFSAEAFLPPRGVTDQDEIVPDKGEERYVREERAGIQGDDDGFEDIPK